MPRWRNKIVIKSYFTEDSSDQSVLNVCQQIIPQLKFVLRKEEKRLEKGISNPVERDNIEYLVDELSDIIVDFEWIEVAIHEGKDARDFLYRDWCEAFNDTLNFLYNIGDAITIPKNAFNDTEKFLWIE